MCELEMYSMYNLISVLNCTENLMAVKLTTIFEKFMKNQGYLYKKKNFLLYLLQFKPKD